MSLLAVVGVLAFFVSAPIVLGGLAATLGLEGRRRTEEGRSRTATAAVVLGVLACLGGTALWLAGV
jgi:hypothetical protein